MDKLTACVSSVFRRFQGSLGDDMVLGDIPDFDSMMSVTLQMEIETAFGVDLSDSVLASDMRVSELRKLIEERAAKK